ncbi:dihydrofolate reductase family protein [Williamsia sp. CHRR-6]|uniref:dihydrofolate reductase family protein n=1 Tax=Williamsia sp. CHRR-6 TaxID=2835871 RepID=UPI001BDA28CF|nr:dihydrofolate reductase family protein [Williamsia sp. CHRR-6]MBT0567961.1 dihydrofolate reductase family protein [Williamsia sp. CHRR-6]
MHLLQKATQLTIDDAGLASLYAYPDVGNRWWVRANMISSIDGAAAVDGVSGGLGGPGDLAVFSQLRALADVVLVGSGTVTAEDYRPIEPADADAGAPTLAIVSAGLNLQPTQRAVGSAATVILTCAAAPPARRQALTDAGATLVDCGDGEVDLNLATAHLAEHGRRRILCEGGPSLLGAMAASGLIDEVCTTISPLVVGGDGGRIVGGPQAQPHRMTRAHVLADDDGFLFTRWVRDND